MLCDEAVAAEFIMPRTIDVAIPLDPEAAKVLENPTRRRALGRYVSELLKGGGVRDVLADAIADAKREAGAKGLMDEDIDAELQAWYAERRG